MREVWGAGAGQREGEGTEKEGKGGGEESMDGFDFLIFKCCLEGNKGTILQRLLISRASDQCDTALKILNK